MVKLLLLDPSNQLLLIEARDPSTNATCWYPVGGGIEVGESLQDAAAREADEETGLRALPPGRQVWRRDHTYEFDGRRFVVHEEWLLHGVEHFDPRPAQLTADEVRTILGFRWWSVQELTNTAQTIFPPKLGRHLEKLIADGVPSSPIDITEPKAGAVAGN